MHISLSAPALTVSTSPSSSSSCRASSDQTGELSGDPSERLHQEAEPPRVRRRHHPRGPRVGQSDGGQGGHEVQVGARFSLLGRKWIFGSMRQSYFK